MEGERERARNDGSTGRQRDSEKQKEGERVKRVIYPPHCLEETESLFIHTDDNPQLKHSCANSKAEKFRLKDTPRKERSKNLHEAKIGLRRSP